MGTVPYPVSAVCSKSTAKGALYYRDYVQLMLNWEKEGDQNGNYSPCQIPSVSYSHALHLCVNTCDQQDP